MALPWLSVTPLAALNVGVPEFFTGRVNITVSPLMALPVLSVTFAVMIAL
jgi:hypothetical protein